jgi:hypothetical protein
LNEEPKKAARARVRESATNFINALRLEPGFDARLLDELKEALIAVGVAYADETTLPKSLVNDLVGLFSWIDSASYLYKDEEARQIQRAAGEVEQLVFVHIVPAGDEDEE